MTLPQKLSFKPVLTTCLQVLKGSCRINKNVYLFSGGHQCFEALHGNQKTLGLEVSRLRRLDNCAWGVGQVCSEPKGLGCGNLG